MPVSLRNRLFRDADCAELFCQDNGRASVALRELEKRPGLAFIEGLSISTE